MFRREREVPQGWLGRNLVAERHSVVVGPENELQTPMSALFLERDDSLVAVVARLACLPGDQPVGLVPRGPLDSFDAQIVAKHPVRGQVETER